MKLTKRLIMTKVMRFISFSGALVLILLLMNFSSMSLFAQPNLPEPQVTKNKYGTILPTEQMQKVMMMSIESLKDLHLNAFDAFDADAADKVFEDFIVLLDDNKSRFLQSDYDALVQLKEQHRVQINQGGMTFPYSAATLVNTIRRNLLEDNKATFSKLTEDDLLLGQQIEARVQDSAYFASNEQRAKYWAKRYQLNIIRLMAEGSSFEEALKQTQTLIDNQIKYFNDINAQDVFNMYMNTLLSRVEAHTYYQSPQSEASFNTQMQNELKGIGAALRVEDYYVYVEKLTKGGPAQLSGLIHQDDRIIEVKHDGEWVPVVGMRLNDVTDMIKGPPDSVVEMKIVGDGMPLSSATAIAITRGVINVSSMELEELSRIFEHQQYKTSNKIGIITIPQFYSGLTEDVAKRISVLLSEGAEGIVLDVRGNGGGLLLEAQGVASLFLEGGPIVYTKGKKPWITTYSDKALSNEYRGPLAVLIDRGSASASEILAGAIQDHQRGIIIGETSFGKGTVQNIYPLDDIAHYYWVDGNNLGGLGVTHSMFYRSNGVSTQVKGVTPDVYLFDFDSELWGESTFDSVIENKILKNKHAAFLPSHNFALSQEQTQSVQRVLNDTASKDPIIALFKDQLNPSKTGPDYLTLSENSAVSEQQRFYRAVKTEINARRTASGLPAIEKNREIRRELETNDPLLPAMVMAFDHYIEHFKRD